MFAAAVLLPAAASAAPQERVQEGGIMGPYAGLTRTGGPATICGGAFRAACPTRPTP
jgi:hypothetical protein